MFALFVFRYKILATALFFYGDRGEWVKRFGVLKIPFVKKQVKHSEPERVKKNAIN